MTKQLVIILACGIAFVSVPASAALKLGEKSGPVELLTFDGKRMMMNNFKERPATAVVFLSPRCPLTERSITDIVALHQKYRQREVLYVGIVTDKDVSSDELTEFMQKRGVIFPIYRDPDNRVVKQFGATITPEVFLLDGNAKLVYHGGLTKPAERNDLEGVIKNILARKPVKPRTVAAVGTPIKSAQPPIKRDDPYGQVSFSSEMIFDRIPQAPAHHCSVVEQAPNGDLLCVWYGGSYESGDDQTIFLARRSKSSRTWSVPEPLLQNSLRPPGNAVIFVDGRKRVWLVWCRMERTRPIRRGSGWNRCRLMSRISEDSGRHWTKDKIMFDEELWAVPRNRPITLKNGTMVLPVEAVVDDVEGSTFLTTQDNGQTWRIGGFTSGGSQPALAERKDGTLMALMRKRPRITEIFSKDSARTWTDARPTTLKNPNAGISMIQLANGHLVTVFNDTETSRSPLSITRSLDEGRTWESPLKLEANYGEYSYPSLLQTDDGMIHVTYTFRRYGVKHVQFNENWLVHLTRPN